MLHVPAVAMDDDFLERLLARENRRQHDAVVVDARLGVEDRHVVGVGRRLEQLFQGAARRHAVADDDQALLASRHGGASGWRLDGRWSGCSCRGLHEGMAFIEELEDSRAAADVGGVADQLDAIARAWEIDLQDFTDAGGRDHWSS